MKQRVVLLQRRIGGLLPLEGLESARLEVLVMVDEHLLAKYRGDGQGQEHQKNNSGCWRTLGSGEKKKKPAIKPTYE